MKKLPNANEKIMAKSVRLIDDQGEMLGVVPTISALNEARKKGLDLVEVSPNAAPPVCKIIDFGKYKYELQKKAHEAKKKQKIIDVKEIKVRPNIGEHDFQIKLKHTIKFLEYGDKVKVSMRFRGREIVKQDIAMNIMKTIVEATKEIGKPELWPRMEGRQLLMILAPTKVG